MPRDFLSTHSVWFHEVNKKIESCLLTPNFNFVTVKRNSRHPPTDGLDKWSDRTTVVTTHFCNTRNLTTVVFGLTEEKYIRVEHLKQVSYNFQKGSKI